MSRDHARVIREGDEFVIEDLGSTHGTYVNQERIDRRVLAPNDKIRLGGAMSHIMTFRSGDEFTMMVGTTGKVTAAGVVTSTPHTRGSSVNVAALLEISKALNSSLRLKDVLEKVIDAVMALTKAERGLLLLGRSADALNIEVRRGEEGTGNESQFSRSVVGAVFETGEAQILTDIAGDERFNAQQSIVGLQLRTVMCVPLRLSHFGQDIEDDDLEPYQTDASNPGAGANKTRILGVVYVDRRSPTNYFNDEDLQVFESMTGHAAIAIDNARLYEEALEKRRLDEDLQVASRIQQSLLLSDFPDLPWADVHAMNLAARVVGGDYYEFFDAPSGALGFAVGDVSGKGFPAAMLMSTLQAAFLAAASTSEDLAAICAQLNQFVVKRTSPERYATFFVGLLSEDGHVRYVNCGHNPAIHLSSAEPATLMGGGLPIGLFPDRTYEVQELQLARGDTLVVFSDGVTEANDPEENELGDERLTRVVVANRNESAERMVKAVFDDVHEFAAGAPQHDDVTMMIIKYG